MRGNERGGGGKKSEKRVEVNIKKKNPHKQNKIF